MVSHMVRLYGESHWRTLDIFPLNFKHQTVLLATHILSIGIQNQSQL